MTLIVAKFGATDLVTISKDTDNKRKWPRFFGLPGSEYAVPDLREGPGSGAGGRPPTNRGASHQTPQFLAKVSLVILTEDFEINEKLCTLAIVSTALLTFALDDLAFNSVHSLRVHQN